jgi:hypothetical protein
MSAKVRKQIEAARMAKRTRPKTALDIAALNLRFADYDLIAAKRTNDADVIASAQKAFDMAYQNLLLVNERTMPTIQR